MNLKSSSIVVRPAVPSDAKEIWQSHVQSIREVCSKDYTPEVIEAWSAFQFIPDHWPKTIEQDAVWVLEVDGKVRGFCHSKLTGTASGEVVGLYIAHDAVGVGGGKLLIRQALDFFRKKKVARVTLDSTKTAKAFYERFGFTRVGDPKFIERKGQRIECLPMELNAPLSE